MFKQKLIVLFPNRFREFDWQRFDLKFLKEKYKFEIEVHDLGAIIHSKKVIFPGKEIKKVIRFKSYLDWKNRFKEIINEKQKNITILNFIKVENLLSFLINLQLNVSKKKVIEFSSTQHPVSNFKLNKSLFNKFLLGSRNPKVIKHFINLKFFIFLKKIFNIHPTHALKCGSEGFLVEYNKKKIKVVEGNAYDYSMYINEKKNIIQNQNKNNKHNYALFLETAGPLFPGDNQIKGLNMNEIFTEKNWFPPLRNFFDNLEKLLNLEVKIASHPRSRHLNNFPDYYGNREILKEKIISTASKAKILISRNSAGLSFGPIFKKPIIMVISNELKLYDTEREVSNTFAQELGVKIVNINNEFDKKKIIDSLNFNPTKYIEYIKKYLTTRSDEKPNYQIINEIAKSR